MHIAQSIKLTSLERSSAMTSAAKFLRLFFFSLFLTLNTAVAAELRVTDSQGLTRALKNVKAEATLVIEVSDPNAKSCHASNDDGIAADLEVQVDSNGTCTFRGIAPGSWRITSPKSAWKARISG